MPKFDSSAQWYHEVEVDRREAHTSSIMTLKVPFAFASLFGLFLAPLAWFTRKALQTPTDPTLWVYAFSAVVPLLVLVYYFSWWMRENARLNREAKPQEIYNSNPPLRRDWVRTIEDGKAHDRAVFLHADDVQLAAVARHVQAGRSFNVPELKQYFGDKVAPVQQFYSDLVSSKVYGADGLLHFPG